MVHPTATRFEIIKTDTGSETLLNIRNPSKLVISGLKGLDLFCITNGLIGISDVKKHFAISIKTAEEP